MSEQLLKAFDYFESNQFEKAFQLFLIVARDTSLSSEQRHQAYQHLLKCTEYDPSISKNVAIQFEYIEFLHSTGEFIEANQLLKDNEIKKVGVEKYSSLRWKSCLEVGSIEEAIHYLQQEINEITRRGDAGKLEILKSIVESKKISYIHERVIELLICIIRGEYKKIGEFLITEYKNKDVKNRNQNLTSLVQSCKSLSVNVQADLNKQLAGKCILITDLLLQKDLGVKELKYLTSLIFESITLGLDPFLMEVYICEYTLKSKRKEFYLLCEDIFTDNSRTLYRQRYQKQMEKEERRYTAMRTFDQSEMDFGTDLFREENKSEYDISAKKERLVREISLLKKSQRTNEANKLIKELEGLDDEHPYVKELNESLIGRNASRILKKRNGIDEIINNITKEISLYSRGESVGEDNSSSLGALFHKNVQYMELSEFQKSQRDLIVSCLSFDIPDVALQVLDDERSVIAKESLEYSFYKLSILAKRKQDHLALDYCNEILDEKVMLDNERITFLYLKAELLRTLGKRVEAIKTYQAVCKIDPNYRLVKYRMAEIDQL